MDEYWEVPNLGDKLKLRVRVLEGPVVGKMMNR